MSVIPDTKEMVLTISCSHVLRSQCMEIEISTLLGLTAGYHVCYSPPEVRNLLPDGLSDALRRLERLRAVNKCQ